MYHSIKTKRGFIQFSTAFCALFFLIGCDVPAPVAEKTPEPSNNVSSLGRVIPVAKIGKTEDGWFQSYADAVTESRTSGKPIMIDFTGSDWCGWCIKLDKEVFHTDEFKKWADDHVVLLKLDFPRSTQLPKDVVEQNSALQQEYAIRGFPTILLTDAGGKIIGKLGYEAGGPEVWTRKASQLLR